MRQARESTMPSFIEDQQGSTVCKANRVFDPAHNSWCVFEVNDGQIRNSFKPQFIACTSCFLPSLNPEERACCS